MIELIHSGQDSRRSLAPAGHPGSGSNSRIGTTSTLAIISHKRYVSLSGRWKRGIFSRAKNSKNPTAMLLQYCNHKVPIAFGGAANNDSSRHRTCRSKAAGQTAQTGGGRGHSGDFPTELFTVSVENCTVLEFRTREQGKRNRAAILLPRLIVVSRAFVRNRTIRAPLAGHGRSQHATQKGGSIFRERCIGPDFRESRKATGGGTPIGTLGR